MFLNDTQKDKNKDDMFEALNLLQSIKKSFARNRLFASQDAFVLLMANLLQNKLFQNSYFIHNKEKQH